MTEEHSTDEAAEPLTNGADRDDMLRTAATIGIAHAVGIASCTVKPAG